MDKKMWLDKWENQLMKKCLPRQIMGNINVFN